MEWILRSVLIVNGVQLAPVDSIPFPTFAACEAALPRRTNDILCYLRHLEATGSHLEALSMCSNAQELRNTGHSPIDDSPELTRLLLASWRGQQALPATPTRREDLNLRCLIAHRRQGAAPTSRRSVISRALQMAARNALETQR